LIEWRENGTRLRESAGRTPAEALEAQKRKQLHLEAKQSGLEFLAIKEPEIMLLTAAVNGFLSDIKTFRKPLTYQKYEHILQIFSEYVAPKTDVRDIDSPDVKKFLAWRKSVTGLRPRHYALHRPGDPTQLLQ
jgi:hypothetical protein